MKNAISLFFILVFALLEADCQEISKFKIDSFLNSEFQLQEDPGFTIGIFRNGKLIYQKQNGLANLEYNVPLSEKTVFNLASITKQFTSACIGILQNKNKLNVEDDVRKYLPELKFYGDTIRIKHLLNHTSGIRNHNVLLDLQGFDYKHSGYTNKMIQKLMFQQQGVNNKPGEKVLYSNTNYVLLALIIERVSGIPIHEFAKKELFEPLEMTSTFYQSDLESIVKNRAYSYYKSNGKYKQPKSLTLCVGAGGVGSTLQDMAKWSDLFTNSSSKMKYLSRFITTQEQLLDGETSSCARGVYVSTYKGIETIHHGGRGLGMRAKLIHLPSKNSSVFVFTNSESINADYLAYKIVDFLIPKNQNLQSTTLKAHQHSTKILKTFEGTYQELNSDLKMIITMGNNTLMAKSYFGDEFIELEAFGKYEFKRKNNASVGYSFIPNSNSAIQLIVNFGGTKFYFVRITPVKELSNVNDFIGEYYSKELQVSYSMNVTENQLNLSFRNNLSIPLHEGRKDEFGSGRRTKYSFKRDKSGKVISFTVAAEGTVKNILFEKVN